MRARQNNMATNDWNIQTRANTCQGCQQKFEDKQACHTLLVPAEENYLRMDLCAGCWAKDEPAILAHKTTCLSQWQGHYEKPVPIVDAIKKENAEELLRRLIALGEARHKASCFILAVMLERKRILKSRESIQQGEGRTLVYEHARTGEVITIIDPHLRFDQLAEVQAEVSRLLDHGSEPETPAATEPSLEPAPADAN